MCVWSPLIRMIAHHLSPQMILELSFWSVYSSSFVFYCPSRCLGLASDYLYYAWQLGNVGICRQKARPNSESGRPPSLCPNGVWGHNYGGETLTKALPPFLAKSPTILLASKFHTPRYPIVFQVRIILNLLRSALPHDLFLIHFTFSFPLMVW